MTLVERLDRAKEIQPMRIGIDLDGNAIFCAGGQNLLDVDMIALAATQEPTTPA